MALRTSHGLRRALAGVAFFFGIGAVAVAAVVASGDGMRWVTIASAALATVALAGFMAALFAPPPALKDPSRSRLPAAGVLTIVAMSALSGGMAALATGLPLLAVACYLGAATCLAGALKGTLARSST